MLVKFEQGNWRELHASIFVLWAVEYGSLIHFPIMNV
jgi:hypothetical protein